jgi:hypothetical protein
MNDEIIRSALLRQFAKKHANSDTVIVNELKVARGSSRLDIAVLDDRINGFEIKSDHDTLSRLPSQLRNYNHVVDRMTIVVGERYLGKVLAMVPEWWGVMQASPKGDGEAVVKTVRRPNLNRSINARGLLELLKRDELVGALHKFGLEKGHSKMTMWDLIYRAENKIKRSDLLPIAIRNMKFRATRRLGSGGAFVETAIDCRQDRNCLTKTVV